MKSLFCAEPQPSRDAVLSRLAMSERARVDDIRDMRNSSDGEDLLDYVLQIAASVISLLSAVGSHYVVKPKVPVRSQIEMPALEAFDKNQGKS